ncbi:hypothetical protein EON64_03835 [archaeon]|nr:MAG: hypothetical protein EON64_03835 [archaeon]
MVIDFHNEAFSFKPATRWQHFRTRFNFWKQLPWRKIKGKVILKASISGSLSVSSSTLPSLISSATPSLAEHVNSLNDLMKLFVYGAHDPRVLAIYLGKRCLYELPPMFCSS